MKDRAYLALLTFVALLLSGCYAHSPIAVVDARPGTAVRVQISPAEAERLTEVLGAERRVLSGSVVEQGATGLLVQVPGSGTASTQRLAQRVLLSPSEIVELEVRRLDQRRTAGLVAGLVTVGGYVAWTQFATARGGSSGDPPVVNEARIPAFRP